MSLIDKFCRAVDQLHQMDLDIQAQGDHWGTPVSNLQMWKMMQSILRAHLFNEALPVHVQLHYDHWVKHYQLDDLVSPAFSESESLWFLDQVLDTFDEVDKVTPAITS